MRELLFEIPISDIRLSAILFDEAFRIRQMTDPQGVVTQMKTIHRHVTYEIFFLLDGALSLTDENGTAVYERSTVIVPPHFHHYTVPSSAKGYCMYFSMQQISGSRGGRYRAVSEALGDRVTVFPLNDRVDFYIRRLAEIFEENGDRTNAEHLLALLFSELFKAVAPHESVADAKRTKSGNYNNKIDLYISTHYCERIRLSDLAAELYLCPKQVTRILQKEYGASLSELVNERRLTAACMLLKYTNLEIGQVARTVGYEHENYFFTLFRRAYGMTPARFRQINHSSEAEATQ